MKNRGAKAVAPVEVLGVSCSTTFPCELSSSYLGGGAGTTYV